MDLLTLVAILRHLRKEDDQEHHGNHKTDQQIRCNQYRQVIVFQHLELRIVQQGTLVTAHRVEFCLYEVHGHEHADDRAARIKALGEVQSSCCRLLVTHRQDIGITTRFQERQSAGHDEIRHKEAAIYAYSLGWEEQQCANGI